MTKISIPYFILPTNKDSSNQKSEYLPMVEVKLQANHHFSPYQINAIMDSGSNLNLFHSYYGQQLGIKVKKGKLVKIRGIGNIVMNAYVHDINLKIDKFIIPTKIHFSDYQSQRQIIGTCTFNFFRRVIFNETKKTLILEK
jgi:hypothetical protein